MVLVIFISLLCFISFFQKAENDRLKKASWPKYCNIVFFLFLIKIGSVGPEDQQIKPLTIITKHSILDVAAALEPPLVNYVPKKATS